MTSNSASSRRTTGRLTTTSRSISACAGTSSGIRRISISRLRSSCIDSLNTEISPGLTYGQSLGLSTDPNVAIDINNYLSDGNNREAFKDAFQPRLGFSYDLGGDQAHVFFGGVGRAYDRTLYDYLQLEQNKFALAQAEVRFNTADHPCPVNGSSCVTWNPAFAEDVGNAAGVAQWHGG